MAYASLQGWVQPQLAAAQLVLLGCRDHDQAPCRAASSPRWGERAGVMCRLIQGASYSSAQAARNKVAQDVTVEVLKHKLAESEARVKELEVRGRRSIELFARS